MSDQPHGQKPALTVVIQSWWTPAIAVIALVIGLIGGYFGRPMISKEPQQTGNIAGTGNIAAAKTPLPTSSITQNTAPTATIDPTLAAIQNPDQLMAFFIKNTTHFQGDANAKVTLIEFSDYQ